MLNSANRIATKQHPEPQIRRSVRVLTMLGELHKAGFQRLRAMPYMSESGAYWRLLIAPASLFHRNHGALVWDVPYPPTHAERELKAMEELSVTYSSGSASSGEYFGWKDAGGDDARELAAKFLARFPGLAEAGDGWDYAYVGWFQRLIGLAERGWFPEVFSSSHSPGRQSIQLTDMRPDSWRECGQERPHLPLPPQGELQLDADLG
jgi:hypothetical protein